MQNFNYDQSTAEQYNEDKKIFPWNTNPYQINFELKREAPTPNDTTVNNYHQNQALSRSQLAHLRESPAARARRLARNAERMREKRARESDEERRKRLDKNALNNRLKRLNESPTEKAIRQVRDAARQRLRRAMETQDQRESRLRKLAERMRMVRRHESPDKKAERLAKAAQRARDRLQRETSEERRVRLQKGSDYARRVRSKKSTADCSSAPDTSDSSNQNTISSSIYSSPSSERVLKIPQHQQQHQSVNFYENSVVQSNNYNFVNFNNSLSALAFNDPSSNIPQPVNNSIITLNIPHYHTVFSSQPPHIHQPNHQPKNFINPHVVKEEIYPKHQLMSSTSKNQDVSSSSSDNYLTLKPNESEFERMEKLRKSAELSRLRRNNETPEQRSKRLNDLKMRARKRREEIKNSESEEERKNRLAKQAEYARQRRQRDTKKPDGYLKIGDSQSAILMSDKPSVLKILEPIIEMNT